MATPPPSRSVNTRMAASPLCKRPAAASTTTMWRLVDAPDRRHPLARYPVRACPCADRGVGGVGVWLRLDIDATARSITPKARRKRPATWKKTFGHHLLLVFQDRPEIAGGKVWDRLRGVAETNGCIGHMKQVLDAAREADIRVFYALHRRYRPGDYETWKYVAPIQKAAWERKTFEYGTWGGELRDEFLPQRRRHRGRRALVLKRFREHGPGLAAEETRDPRAHRHRPHRAHLCRGNRPLRRRARLPGHGGQGRDRRATPRITCTSPTASAVASAPK